MKYLKSGIIVMFLIITLSGVGGFLWCKAKLGTIILLFVLGKHCITYYFLKIKFITTSVPLGIFTKNFLENLTFVGVVRLLLFDYPLIQANQRGYRLGLFYYSGIDKSKLSTKLALTIVFTLCGLLGCPYLGLIIIIRYFVSFIKLEPMTFDELHKVIIDTILKQPQAYAVSYNQRLFYYHYGVFEKTTNLDISKL